MKSKLEENMFFVGTIYDSFEALEETLGKLKLERPLFITHVAKMAFAEEVFKLVEGIPQSCQVIPKKTEKTPKRERLYH
jgi:hypothetical protein